MSGCGCRPCTGPMDRTTNRKQIFDEFMDGKQIEVFTLELAVKANLQPCINCAFFHMLS